MKSQFSIPIWFNCQLLQLSAKTITDRILLYKLKSNNLRMIKGINDDVNGVMIKGINDHDFLPIK